ncbi:RNA polymerase sigma factor [Echinicola salinicaeni]|uniref:RNA polymerase sigma factor n=1 Tax=Echinicola salinicaeni TaxID=2762757 RepID=UPI0016496A25|nr:sigma-70 family RNA polymerase sigma factor [Echinicola salinicaeni]
MKESSIDIGLFERVRKGDKSAFDALYYKYWELLYGSAYARIKSVDLAQDIVQEIFIDIWNRRNKLVIMSDPKVYLLTAVKYKVFRFIDKMRRQETLQNSRIELLSEENNLLEFEEIYERIEVCLEKFSETHKTIFRLNKLEGFNAKEIGLQVGMATQSVHNIISKTTKVVKKELKGYYSIFL